MSRMFRYIQNEDVVKSFRELSKSVLRERPVIIARQGDFTLFLKYITDISFSVTVENAIKHRIYQERMFNIETTSEEVISRGVRHASQKMSELSDEDVNRKRFQIWKWYVMDWRQNSEYDTQAFVEKETRWSDENSGSDDEVLDVEAYLHKEYLNLGHTLSLIEKFMKDDPENCELFKKFAVADIMEMTSEDTKDRCLAIAEEMKSREGEKKHTYKFTVSVEASDKEHARQALLNYLAGDARIRIQK